MMPIIQSVKIYAHIVQAEDLMLSGFEHKIKHAFVKKPAGCGL